MFRLFSDFLLHSLSRKSKQQASKLKAPYSVDSLEIAGMLSNSRFKWKSLWTRCHYTNNVSRYRSHTRCKWDVYFGRALRNGACSPHQTVPFYWIISRSDVPHWGSCLETGLCFWLVRHCSILWLITSFFLFPQLSSTRELQPTSPFQLKLTQQNYCLPQFRFLVVKSKSSVVGD